MLWIFSKESVARDLAFHTQILVTSDSTDFIIDIVGSDHQNNLGDMTAFCTNYATFEPSCKAQELFVLLLNHAVINRTPRPLVNDPGRASSRLFAQVDTPNLYLGTLRGSPNGSKA